MYDTTPPTMYDTVIVRYGEIFLKSEPVRKRFEALLLDSIRSRMRRAGLQFSVEKKRHRIYLRTAEAERACEQLKEVFGIVSVSPAISTSSSMERIVASSEGLASKTLLPGESFAVRAERTGSQGYRSKDVEVAVGSMIVEKFGAKVDLEEPEKTIHIEVRDDSAYVYADKVDGPGGLPYGSQGLLISLLSTGIDSPVASWMMMRRGCRIAVLHLGGPGEVKDIVSRLESLAGEPIESYYVPYGSALSEISSRSGKYTCVICKRFMHRLAERLAEKKGAYGVVSGENIGQVASQTLANLKVISCSRLPVYRPLVAMDKEDIIGEARRIGTYGLSKKGERCPYVPDRPSTEAREETIEKIESEIGMERLLEDVEKGLVQGR